MNKTIIIQAGIKDIMLIHDMAEVVFRHTYRDILSPEQMEYMMEWMYSPENLEKQFADGHRYYIAMDNEKPCGYVSVQPEGEAEDGVLLFHLHKIYVLPSYQKNGLGQKLFGTVVSFVTKASAGRKARIELNVNRSNPSVGFYQRLGMKILRQGDFHIGNGFYMNDYIMGLDLDACK